MKGSRENRSSRGPGGRTRHAAATETSNGGGDPYITVQCPVCEKTYRLQRSRAGKDGRCSCGTIFPIGEFAATSSIDSGSARSNGSHGTDETAPAKSRSARAAKGAEEKDIRREEDNRNAADAADAADATDATPDAPTEARMRRAGAEEAEGSGGEREELDASTTRGLTEVRVGCIGRGHAGKTALLRALGERSVGDFLPSGLHVDAGDPREVAQMIRETEQAERLLHQFGLPPTLEATQIRYFLYEGAQPRVVYKMREVIGQVLTHTLPDSAADQQRRYKDYLRSLVNTHVLWAMVPCPSVNPSPRDRRRYANDLRISLAYVREALKLRTLDQPVALALVLSKMDALFASAEEARAALTDEVLRDSFGPLVHLVEQSSQVGEAVIIPVTTFGFGNAVLRDDAEGRHGTPADMEDEPFGPEPIWLLREGTFVEPYNLEALFLWTLLAGLLGQTDADAMEETPEIAELCRTLAQDLQAIEPWLIPIKTQSPASAVTMASVS